MLCAAPVALQVGILAARVTVDEVGTARGRDKNVGAGVTSVLAERVRDASAITIATTSSLASTSEIERILWTGVALDS